MPVSACPRGSGRSAPGRRRRLATAAVLGVLIGSAAATAAAEPAARDSVRAGMPLVEAFRVLERSGLEIVYASSLVRPEMAVAAEPRAAAPAAVLEEILAPHGLGVRPGPHGALIVVKGRDAEKADGEGSEGASGAADRPSLVVRDQIVVTPSAYRILREEPEGREFLTRDEVERIPHLADDVYRVVGLLPGAAAGDLSAKFHVRGGEEEEILVLVDGLEIYEPFHLKDFQSVFSIVDSEAVGGLELLTGGFPAEFGNRMSAVLDISSAAPSSPGQGTVGMSVVNLRVGGEGGSDRGAWLVSARRGYLDFALDYAASGDFEFSPAYYDLLGKAERWISPRTRLSAHVLASYDTMSFFDRDARGDGQEARVERADSSYGNGYGWLALLHAPSPRLSSRTLASAGRVTRDRRVESDDWDGRPSCSVCDESFALVRDQRSLDVFGLKQDWSWSPAGATLWKWGGEVRRLAATYDYASYSAVLAPLVTGSREVVVTERSLSPTPAGETAGAYASVRRSLSRRAIAEVGLRWDRQSYSPRPDQASPRVGLLLLPGERSSVRVGWGRFFQPQGPHELPIQDGVGDFSPAQLAEHRLLAADHRFAGGVHLRVEAFQKRYSRLRPRFENLFEPFDLAAEAAPDRVRIAAGRARVEGLEVVLRRARRGRFDGWISYAWSSAKDEIDGESVPRSWDQRHALTVDVDYRWSPRWSLNLVWVYHTGWPTTPVGAAVAAAPDGSQLLVPALGPRNSARFPPYHRLDLRVGRELPTRRGAFQVFFEVTNLYDRANVRAISDFDFVPLPGGGFEVRAERERWLPRIPSFGLSWRF